MNNKTFDDIVDEMKAISDQLVRYNSTYSSQLNEYMKNLKEVSFFIDGYPVTIYLNKSKNKENFIEYLQIQPKWSAFLPFSVVFKIVQRFLGSRFLYLSEINKGGQKIYFWMVCVNSEGKPINLDGVEDYEENEFNGVKYRTISPSNITFY